jgi:1-acyl-sn-glycerol-3-phosphate acyltransferase
MREKKGLRRRVKRPGAVRYVLLGGIVAFYAAAFKRQKLVSRLPEGVKPPFIIVGNHTSFYDFVYAVRAFFPKRINFVVARKYFHFKGLGWVMKTARAIPKSLYQNDTGTIMKMFDILKQGGIVGIYPEGQISINGISIENSGAIAKFVKKAGVPVVSILTGGSYFCNPPWAKSVRKGRVESKVDLILTKAQVQSLSVNEILEKIRESIYHNSYAWQKVAGYVYRGEDLAHGLENILYICPDCGEEYTFTARGDTVRCKSCGLEARYGEDGHLRWDGQSRFEHVGDWQIWQIEQETAHIAGDDGFSISEPVRLSMLKRSGKGVETVGSGAFTADRDAYTYTGTQYGKDVTLTFPAAAIRYLPFDSGKSFHLYHNDLMYEFIPENPVFCMKIANICEGFHAVRERVPAGSVAGVKAE